MADAEQRLLMLIDDEPAQSRLITALASREGWRTLAFSDADMKRPNFLYSVDPERLSPAAAAVRGELRETVRQLVSSGTWQGVNLL